MNNINSNNNINNNNINNNNNIYNNNQIFNDVNIVKPIAKNTIKNQGNKEVYTIIVLQDGRLASAGEDNSIRIYNQKPFAPEITIQEHKKTVWDIIQLKNGNILSCSYNDKTMKEYILFKNNTYNLISIVDARKGSPQKIIELVNNEIPWIAENDIIFIPIKIVIPTISKKNQKLNPVMSK